MHSSNRATLKIAVVGLGKMGLLHSSILNFLPDVKLIALCDKSAIIRKISRKLFSGLQLTDDVKKLAYLDLDAVYITTPIPSHFFIAKVVFSEKIARNVFVEKTLASSYEEAKELCMLAESFSRVNMVGYMKRFGVTFKKAKDLLDREVLEEVASFSAYAYSSDFYGLRESSKLSASRGGVLGDLGSHIVDLALWYFGDLQVQSVMLESLHGASSEDFAHFLVKRSDGLEGRFDVTWCKKGYRMPEFGFLIQGKKGVIRVNDDEVRLELDNGKSRKWYRHDLNDNVDFLLGAPEYFREDDHFIKSILNGSATEPDFDTASKVDYFIDQAKNKAVKNE